jgi:hypothetical protein
MLAGRFPKRVWPVDIGDIGRQMELFDRLVADTASTKVIYTQFREFELRLLMGRLNSSRRRSSLAHRPRAVPKSRSSG